MRRPERQRAGGSGRQRGLRAFTLVELLVVISIILILIGILMPTVLTAIREGYAARTMSYIQKNLVVGADNYKHERGYYPGQDTKAQGHLRNGTYTGSQILAACLFQYANADPPAANNDPYAYILSTNITNQSSFPSPDVNRAYASYKKEYLADVRVKQEDGSYGNPIRNSLADGFPGPKAMAILYYPSHTEIDTAATGKDPRDQFRYADKEVYMTAETSEIYDANDNDAQNNLKAEITSSGFSGILRPYNDGMYLLVGAGVKRKYFDDDDLTNY